VCYNDISQKLGGKFIMKNVEQLIADMKADEGLRKKFREGLNRLRSDETLSVIEAGIKVARELGY